jgi:hypothetical protein
MAIGKLYKKIKPLRMAQAGTIIEAHAAGKRVFI